MDNKVDIYNKNTDLKNKTLEEAIKNIEYYPVLPEENRSIEEYKRVPLSRVSAMGTAFKPVASAFQSAASDGKARSGIYRVKVPNGGELAKFQKESAYLGSVLTPEGAVGGGQARLNPIHFDPTMVFMAHTLISIDIKLDEIKKMQQEILDFLVQKERSELRGDLNFLSDVLNNYKYNWDNDKYKNSNHIKVLDIRQTAERKIDFYREQIQSEINKRSRINTEQLIKKQLEKIQENFKDYQLALYSYSFSSFLEVMLLENFDSKYLNRIISKIKDYSFIYRELYTKTYNYIEKYARSSIEANLINKLASFNKFAGKAISKTPVISRSQIDEKLIESGDKLGEFSIKRIEDTLKGFVEKQNVYVRPFIENINTINKLYNEPMEVLFDRENMYMLE